MSAPRLFAPGPYTAGDEVALGPDAAHHARVLRLEHGDALVLFDGEGAEADALLTRTDGARIERVRRLAQPSPLVLAQAWPKGDKVDDIVRMAVEIGATRVHLWFSARSVARPPDARARVRVERLARIALEAARQSEQPFVPEITGPTDLAGLLSLVPADATRLVPSPRVEADARPLAGASGPAGAWIVVGPEGGLDPEEEARFERAGFVPCRLPTGVLRTETAGVALLTAARVLAAPRAVEPDPAP